MWERVEYETLIMGSVSCALSSNPRRRGGNYRAGGHRGLAVGRHAMASSAGICPLPPALRSQPVVLALLSLGWGGRVAMPLGRPRQAPARTSAGKTLPGRCYTGSIVYCRKVPVWAKAG